MSAREIIDALELRPHPEGGYFKEIYRSDESVEGAALPARYGNEPRCFSTAIYFLLDAGNFSAFHRIKGDEVWHHYEGAAVEIVVIYPDGSLSRWLLGKNLAAGERPLLVVPHGCWFASRVPEGDYALVGCTVAPGFDFLDFEMGSRVALLEAYPQHRQIIGELTRE